MTDTLSVGEVNHCDLVGAEADGVLTIGRERTDRNAFAAKCLRHFPAPPLEADVVLAGRSRAHDLVAVVFSLGQPIGHRPRARPIAACWHLLIERLMRPFEIVQQGLRTPTGPFSENCFIIGIRGSECGWRSTRWSTRPMASSSDAR